VVYTGGRSHAALQKVARRLAEAASARLVIVPEAGHAVQHAGDALQQSLLLYLSAAG